MTNGALNWLHCGADDDRWIGIIRALIEPRIPELTAFQLRLCSDLREISPDQDQNWDIVTSTHNISSPTASWDWAYRARHQVPRALRVLLAAPDNRLQQLALLEAGAQLILPDIQSFCRALPTLLMHENSHS